MAADQRTDLPEKARTSSSLELSHFMRYINSKDTY